MNITPLGLVIVLYKWARTLRKRQVKKKDNILLFLEVHIYGCVF